MSNRRYVQLFGTVSTSKKLASLPDDSCRLFYDWLLTKLDAWGRARGDPEVLNHLVWPMLNRADEEVSRILRELDRAGLVVIYRVRGEDCLAIPDWEDKAGSVTRVNRRGASSFPPPPRSAATQDSLLIHNLQTPGVDSGSGLPPDVRDGIDVRDLLFSKGAGARANATAGPDPDGPCPACGRAALVWERHQVVARCGPHQQPTHVSDHLVCRECRHDTRFARSRKPSCMRCGVDMTTPANPRLNAAGGGA